MASKGHSIRRAERGDAPLLLEMIRELAAYERLAEEVVGDADRLERSLFELGAAEALIAEVEGEPVGYAIYFTTFSTFLCWPGLWCEDIYVRPRWRGEGVGRALFAAVAGVAAERDYGRLDWVVLEWNETAIAFYEGLGASHLSDWQTMRLDAEALRQVAAEAPAIS
ncbi:MAG TPA: GNAT family N-acetyltransferase [Solirubrobacterales bacterium]|jgi:GNAT superfamily N-acetyltransferase